MRCFRPIVAAAILLGASITGLAIAGADTQPTGYLTQSTDPKTTCDAAITRTIVPDVIRECETSSITLHVFPRCDPLPIDVALMFGSGWCWEDETLYRKWQSTAVDSLGLGDNPHVRAAVVWYDKDGARLRVPLIDSDSRVCAALANRI